MYYLQENDPPPADSPAPRYWLGGVSATRLIGRKNVDIRIKQPSVSRTHAKIGVVSASRYSLSKRNVLGEHRRSTAVFVEDSSAYGTYVKYDDEKNAADTHHVRLGKNVNTEVLENALLAFGAPNFWWRLGWHNVLCFIPEHVPDAATVEVTNSARRAGIEVANQFSDIVTHVVLDEVKLDCMPVIAALARGNFAVSFAWVTSVQRTVQDSCSAITSAQNLDAALASSKLPDERNYPPSFSRDMSRKYPGKVIDGAFTATAQTKREALFKNRVFAFVKEESRETWEPILKSLDAKSLSAGSMKKGNAEGYIIVEEEEVTKRKRTRVAKYDVNSGTVTESSLIAAVLSGDEAHIVQECPAPIVDEVTDIEEEVEEIESNRKRVTKKTDDSQCTEKTASGIPPAKKLRSEYSGLPHADDDGAGLDDVDDAESDDKVNVRVQMPVKPENGDDEGQQEPRRSTGKDVRRFRRKAPPTVRQIPTKRAKTISLEDEPESTPRRRDRGKSRNKASSPDDLDE